MLTGLVLFAVHAQNSQWYKQWTVQMDGAIRSVKDWNQEIIVLTEKSATVLNPATGKTGVRILFSKGVMSPHAAIWRSKLLLRHAVNIFGKPNGLVCFDLKSGTKDWELPGDDVESEILVEGDFAYVALTADTFSKVDLNSRKPVWTAKTHSALNPKDRLTNHFGVPTKFGDRLVFQNGESVQAWDLVHREQLFALNSSCYSPPTISSSGIVTYRILPGQPNGSTWCYDFTSGAELWHKEDPAPGWTYARIQDNSLFGTDHGVLYRFDIRTGREVWSLRLAPKEEFNRENIVVTDGATHWLAVAGLHEISSDGRLLNSLPLKESFGVAWRGAGYILANGYDALSRYVRGSRQIDPSAEVGRICKDIFSIDDVESEFLTEHREQAGPALLQTLNAELDKQVAGAQKSIKDRDREHRVISLICACVTEANTSAMLSEFQKLNPDFDGWQTIMTAFLKSGKLTGLTTFLNTQIFNGKPNVRVEMTLEAALDADRREIGKIVGDALRRRTILQRDRAQAVLVAAVFGEEEFIDQLPAERAIATTVTKFSEQVQKSKFTIVSSAVLKGVTYQLVLMNTAGNRDDLWIRRVDTDHRFFTGVSTLGATLVGIRLADDEELIESRQKDLVREKYKNGGWYKDLERLSQLELDTDNDGLSDLVEARFGTDTNSSDSDADGLPDDIDAWPLTALRPLSEEEKLLNQAFLAAEPSKFVSYSLLQGTKLPQLGTNGARVFPSEKSLPNRGLVTELFGFEAAQMDVSDKGYSDCIEYNPDRTIAKVSFRMSFHGDTATFRKVRNRWILVGVRMRWIS